MSSVHYDVYLKGIFDLTATLTIKSEATAYAINDYLNATGFAVSETDQTTWKYYLNLSGRYHASDKMMRVRSSDTGEMIDFTVDNLVEHRTTRIDHAYGTKKYRELLSQYPDQQELILGILNPVSLGDAIAAKDHSILYYDKSLVEVQESNLIPRLQKWIDAVFHRWYVSNFNLSSDLHETSFLGVLYSQMIQQVLNIREDNCNTELAHSYHIRAFLDSFGDLGKYFDYMTQKQKLFFYRNLRYLNTNAGRWSTFDLLKDRIFTDRRFPLSEFTIQHNATEIVDNLLPEVEMVRTSMNGYRSEIGLDIQSVVDVLSLEDSQALNNPVEKADTEVVLTKNMKVSRYSSLMTKVLESSVIDRTGTGGLTLEEVVTNHWAYLGYLNRYRTLIVFTHPTTGEEISIGTFDAFLLWLYAYSVASRKTLEEIPVVGCWCVRRIPLPTKLELKSIVDAEVVPDYLIEEAMRDQVDIGTVISPITFMEVCQKVHAGYLRHEDLYRYQADMYQNGELEVMVGRFYHNFEIHPGETTSYDQWLSDRNLDFSNMNEDQFFEMATELFTKATGYVADTSQRLSEIHNAHVAMMTQLSSYSVQYVANSNANELVEARWKMQRGGKVDGFTEAYDRGVFQPYTIITAKGYSYGKADAALRTLELFNENTMVSHIDVFDISLQILEDVKTESYERAKVSVMSGDIVPNETFDLNTLEESDEVSGYELPTPTPLSTLFVRTDSDHYQPLSAGDVSTLRART